MAEPVFDNTACGEWGVYKHVLDNGFLGWRVMLAPGCKPKDVRGPMFACTDRLHAARLVKQLGDAVYYA